MKPRNDSNTMLECYYNCRMVSYLVLHDKFGFGQKRITNLEKAVDKYLDDYSDGVYKTGFFEADQATTLKCASDGTWFDDLGYTYDVIAWQPLPDPYQPKGE